MASQTHYIRNNVNSIVCRIQFTEYIFGNIIQIAYYKTKVFNSSNLFDVLT